MFYQNLRNHLKTHWLHACIYSLIFKTSKMIYFFLSLSDKSNRGNFTLCSGQPNSIGELTSIHNSHILCSPEQKESPKATATFPSKKKISPEKKRQLQLSSNSLTPCNPLVYACRLCLNVEAWHRCITVCLGVGAGAYIIH